MKLKPEIKETWLAALRSGEFKQGRKYLCAVDRFSKTKRYCCLGVLAEILNVPKEYVEVHGNIVPENKTAVFAVYTFPGSPDSLYPSWPSLFIPTTFWMHTLMENPGKFTIKATNEMASLLDSLTCMNDNSKADDPRIAPSSIHNIYNFKKIADWIEENL